MQKNISHIAVCNNSDMSLQVFSYQMGNAEDTEKLALTINHISMSFQQSKYNKTFDTADDMMKFIEEHKHHERYSMSYHFLIIGYEIIDEHYIKLYYNTHVSNS